MAVFFCGAIMRRTRSKALRAVPAPPSRYHSGIQGAPVATAPTRINDVSHTHTRAPRERCGRWCVIACSVGMMACRGDGAAPPPPLGPAIQLSIDDGDKRTIGIDRTIPLASVVEIPPASWLEVRADADDERWLELAKPATAYPGSEIRLYLDQGRVALGVFPAVTPDMPPEIAARARQPTASLTAVVSVQIVTQRSTRLPPLSIVVEGRDIALASDKLRALRRVSGKRAHGWALADVIALAGRASPGAPDPQAIHVVGAETVTVEPAALRDQTRFHLLKPNQRGEYVFRVWESEGRAPTREVRRVTKIVLD